MYVCVEAHLGKNTAKYRDEAPILIFILSWLV